jgi:hypothetical protein
MNRISRNITIIIKAERLIAQRRLAAFVRQTGFMAAAGIAAAIGLVLLNVAAYIALSQSIEPALAALLVATGNFFVAILLMLMAKKSNGDSEIAAVSEVRDIAMDDLELELNAAGEELKVTAEYLRSIAKDPLGTLAPGLVGALAGALLKQFKNQK